MEYSFTINAERIFRHSSQKVPQQMKKMNDLNNL